MRLTRKSADYFTVLDGMRGIAAIFVVLRHATDFFGFGLSESFLAVDLFFVLSGVVIANSYEQRLVDGLDRRKFFWLRLVRIYPLYALGTLIGIFFVPTYSNVNEPIWTWVLLSIFFVPNPVAFSLFPFNGVMWSLFDELVVNVVYAAFVRVLTNAIIRVVMSLSAIGLIVAGTKFLQLDIGFDHTTFVSGFFRILYSFFAGVLLYRRFLRNGPERRGGRIGALFSAAIIVSLAAVLMAEPGESLRVPYEWLAIFLVFPLMVYCAMLLYPAGRVASFYRFLGQISYGIYALHAPLLIVVKLALHEFAGFPIGVTYPYAPWCGWLFVANLVVLCWLADRFYDAPVRRLMLNLYPPSTQSICPR